MVEDVDVPAGPPGSDALRADEAAEPTPRGEPEPVAEPAVRQEVDTQPAGRQEVVTEPATLPFAVGDPGASAQAEFQRRHVKREERIRTRHPRLGGLIMALSDDPQSTRAWAVGADGEQRIGRALNGRSGPRLRVIHDARIPGSRANVDHIAVTPSGVYVIDAKKYQGAPDVRFTGPFMTGQKQL